MFLTHKFLTVSTESYALTCITVEVILIRFRIN